MSIDKKYGALLNEYAKRIYDEKLSGLGKCSMSIKISEILYAIVLNVDGNVVKDSDIIAAGMVSLSHDKEIELHRQVYLHNKSAKAIIHSYPSHSCMIGDAKIIIPPMLDDMAQIIGPDARYAEDDKDSIMKVLKKRNACMITGNGVISYGRSLDEAYVACLILEKSAKCLIDTTVLGGYKRIKPIETRLMHYVYKKKYSKKNQSLKQLNSDESGEKKAQLHISDKEMDLRKQVKDAGIRLLKSNLVQGTWGNISVRIDENNMLITPTGLDYNALTPEDMVVVNYHTMEYQGLHKPSGEKDIHATLFREREDINVVMHSHPSECSAFAAAKIDMPVMSDDMQKYVGGNAKCSEYALPSTKGLARATVVAMKGRNACFMANHGMLSVGKTIEDTFMTCKIMEESARAYIDKLASKRSSAKTSEEKRKDIFRRIYNL